MDAVLGDILKGKVLSVEEEEADLRGWSPFYDLGRAISTYGGGGRAERSKEGAMWKES